MQDLLQLLRAKQLEQMEQEQILHIHMMQRVRSYKQWMEET